MGWQYGTKHVDVITLENNEKKKNKQKSKIRFSESMIQNAIPRKLSRNAIDRFTGGTVNGALFTEITYYGGNTDLVIGIDESIEISDRLAKALAASIVDLHYGFMVVGGETSIGRGLFSITGIDGMISIPEKTDYDSASELYNEIYKMIGIKSKEKEANV